MWAFPRQEKYDADDEGIDVIVKAKSIYKLGKCELSYGERAYPDHDTELFLRKSTQMFDDDGFQAVLQKDTNLAPLQEFVAAYQQTGRKRANALVQLSSPAHKKLAGRAASLMALADPEQQAEANMNVDLTIKPGEAEMLDTPAKRRMGRRTSLVARASEGRVCCRS